MNSFLQTAAKAVAAGVVAAIGILNELFGVGIGPIDPEAVTGVLFALITLVVYFVPNKTAENGSE